MKAALANSLNVHIEAAGRCLMRPKENLGPLEEAALPRAWESAYAEVGRPVGVLDPGTGQALVGAWQKNIVSEMKQVCKESTKPELFFAARLVTPEVLKKLQWHTLEASAGQNLTYTRAVRRIMSDAALLFGKGPPEAYSAPYGGAVREYERERSGRAFLSLLRLSEVYFISWLQNAYFGLGRSLVASLQGLGAPGGYSYELDVLTKSRDTRLRRYYSPFTRIGEFTGQAASVLDPYEGPHADKLGDAVGFFTALYEPDDKCQPGYRFRAWPLEQLHAFLKELDSEVVRKALCGLGPDEFVGLLGGLCLLVKERLRNPDELQAAHASSIIPFDASEVEGERLLEAAEEYLERRGFGSGDYDLNSAHEAFLYLALSTDKGSKDPVFLQTSIGNTRYSYLLHKFGQVYTLDLLHADHWLHRLMDLLASRMGRGPQANLKGERVEDQIWNFMKGADRIEPVEELHRLVVEKKKGHDADDLDCPLKVGDTLVLAEAKGQRLRYEAEAVNRQSIEARWNDSRGYLGKIDDTAKKVGERRKEKDYREGMSGIERILPVVCRPYPEWIPSLNNRYWLRKPTKNDPGVPRVLTPQELKEFLESAEDSELVNLPSEYVVEVNTAS